MPSEKIRVYNDGICYLLKEKVKMTDFRAKENSTTFKDYETVVKLMFSIMSLREQDLEFAQAQSRSVTLKIKTPYYKGVSSEYKIRIDNTLYEIVNFDVSKAKSELYLYLEEVRKLAQ